MKFVQHIQKSAVSMLADFFDSFTITLLPLAQIFGLAVFGAILVWLRVLDRTAVDLLARLVTQVFLPLFIISTIVSDFRPYSAEFAGWYLMPLVAAGTVGAVLAFSKVPARVLSPPEHRIPFMLMAGIQNAGYLPLVILDAFYGSRPEMSAMHDQMLVLLFLYIMGQNPILWFVAVAMSRRTKDQPGEPGIPISVMIRNGISPPLVASLGSIIVCLLGIPQRMPSNVLDGLMLPIQTLGNCTVPLVMLSLGAMIASLNFANRPAKREIFSLAVFRLMFLPFIWLLILEALRKINFVPPTWAVILFIQSMTPPATNLAVLMRRYGSTEASDFLSHALLPLYLISLLTMPFWLTLWSMRSGF